MGDDTIRIDDRHLRPAPRRARRHAGLYAIELCQIVFMTGGLSDTRPEFGLIRHPAIMSNEVAARQLRERPADRDCTREISKAARRRDHGKDKVIDAGDGQPVRADGKLHPRKIGGGCCHVRL